MFKTCIIAVFFKGLKFQINCILMKVNTIAFEICFYVHASMLKQAYYHPNCIIINWKYEIHVKASSIPCIRIPALCNDISRILQCRVLKCRF